mmetsp:Transcript_9771/g.36749  ORF Transcript_9771/g.36749 Transcript_9771/m.36749 type:complete len:213 (-) Transcript_9771:1149-1787(-)
MGEASTILSEATPSTTLFGVFAEASQPPAASLAWAAVESSSTRSDTKPYSRPFFRCRGLPFHLLSGRRCPSASTVFLSFSYTSSRATSSSTTFPAASSSTTRPRSFFGGLSSFSILNDCPISVATERCFPDAEWVSTTAATAASLSPSFHSLFASVGSAGPVACVARVSLVTDGASPRDSWLPAAVDAPPDSLGSTRCPTTPRPRCSFPAAD